MRIFAIKDDTLSRKSVLGYLIYYENAKAFYIELPDDADPWATPLLLSGNAAFAVLVRKTRRALRQQLLEPFMGAAAYYSPGQTEYRPGSEGKRAQRI